ncbi:small ribosomal subunit protein uS5m [Prorops nasuta]|uniref:small ribosomal subunit protein uS5m n=1 Tax=Prorops nasuta TaxID=863751 RepID=UPI0034CFBDBB
MASRVLGAFQALKQPFRQNALFNTDVSKYNNFTNILKGQVPLKCDVRNTTFFTRRPAAHLWKSVLSVSNAGRRRGRAQAIAKSLSLKNLNRGQVIGVGKINMQFPGLNAPIIRGKELTTLQKLPEDKNREERILKYRESVKPRRRAKLGPLERGWSGGKIGGTKIGPPDPTPEGSFEGFESWILEYRLVSTMTRNFGRKASPRALVITGNGNGLAGFAVRKASTRNCIKIAKNAAAKKLMYIERYNEHTVLHDFYERFGNTKVFVSKKHQGYGLKCHRVINACCQAIGIKDIHAKVEGSCNTLNIVKAFFIGLLQQKSYQHLADQKQLHVVEIRDDIPVPTVLASPAKVRIESEVAINENLDVKHFLFDGKVVAQRKKLPPFYTKLPSWENRLKKLHYMKDKDSVRMRLLAEYGSLSSHLTAKYPEAAPIKCWQKQKAESKD